MISIIIPVYNVQEYIVKCLDSIASQTFRGEIECILVDDFSTDDSANIIEQYISSYKGKIDYRLIRLPKNQGQSVARNFGLNVSRGDLIAFVDSDDWIEPNMYEELSKYIYNDDKAIFVTSGIIAEYQGRKEYGHANTDKYTECGIITPYHFLEQLLATKTNNSPCNKLYRKEFVQHPFREGMVSEDFLFFYDNCKELIGTDWHFVTTDKAYYHYIIHHGSTMNQESQSLKPWYVDFLVGMTIVLEECRGQYSELYGIQLKRFASVYSTFFYDIVKNKNLTIYRADSLKKLNKYIKLMDTSKLSRMTRFDMFCASSFTNGYNIVRIISSIRTYLKSLVKR